MPVLSTCFGNSSRFPFGGGGPPTEKLAVVGLSVGPRLLCLQGGRVMPPSGVLKGASHPLCSH